MVDIEEREAWVDCVLCGFFKSDRMPFSELFCKAKIIEEVLGKLWKWPGRYLARRQTRTVIREVFFINECDRWRASGIILIYVSKKEDRLRSCMNRFADDAKIMKHIKNLLLQNIGENP